MHKKLKLNTISSLLFEIVTVVSGFILPRLILGEYGSDINGLVNSITQFIGIISFLELGVGKVVQSALYKPLAAKDDDQVSRIMVSAGKFFNRLAQIMVGYILLLGVFYPFITGQQYGWVFTATLIAAMSISSFAQYYFGVLDRLLLTADQRGYVQYTAQTVTLILNTIVYVILIRLNMSIHMVRLASSLVFLLRPLYLHWYVRRRYRINYRITYDKEPIAQKWNGMAQHIAFVVLNNTDTVVLTVFASLADVSIYSVYHMVVYGVKSLFTSMTNGIEALLGELWARQDRERLDSVFGMTEWAIHTGVVLVFGCTAALILPFVQVYTHGITDAEYAQPLFAVLIVLAHACHCFRLPYNIMIFAAGHYKQTQRNYIVAAVMNIAVSVATVMLWGLVGVAIGTLVSMLYQTVWMAWYNSQSLMRRPLKHFFKQLAVDVLTFGLMFLCRSLFVLREVTYLSWVICAAQCFLLFAALVLAVNGLFYRDRVKQLAGVVNKKFLRKGQRK